MSSYLAGLLILLQVCTSWQEPQKVGELPGPIDEASGLAISRAYPGRMYHANDSGDDGNLFITDSSGGNFQQVRIADFHPVDVEDLRVAPCSATQSCIFIGDIGDNDLSRKTIELVLVEEVPRFGSTARPFKRIRMRYSDR